MYIVISCMYLHVLQIYFADDTETAATSSKHLVQGSLWGGTQRAALRAPAPTLYFAIAVAREARILHTPARHTRLMLFRLRYSLCRGCPWTDPRASILSHAQPQPIWSVGVVPAAGERSPLPLKKIPTVIGWCMYLY